MVSSLQSWELLVIIARCEEQEEAEVEEQEEAEVEEVEEVEELLLPAGVSGGGWWWDVRGQSGRYTLPPSLPAAY